MAQRRMLSKSISTSKKVNRLSVEAALIYTWLIPHCDDFGRMDGDAMSVKAIVVPMRQYKDEQIEECIKEMHKNGLITRYCVNGEIYLYINNFDDFQKFRYDREKVKLYPEPTTGTTKGLPKGEKCPSKLSEVKLSEVKVNNVASDVDEKVIADIIYLFKDVNPNYKTLFSRKGQRDAVKRLIGEHGESKIKNTVSELSKIVTKKFAPRITTPVQFESKLGELIIFIQQEKHLTGKGKEIIGL